MFKESLNKSTLSAKAGQVALQGLAMAGNMLIGMAIGKAVELAATAIDNYVHRVEHANEATMEAIQTHASISSEVTNLEQKISDLNTQIDSLNPVTDKEDIDNLKAETAELNTQLAILKEKERAAANEADEAAQKSLGMKQNSRYETEEQEQYTITDGSTVVPLAVPVTAAVSKEVTASEELQNAMGAYDTYAKQKRKLEEELANMKSEDSGYDAKSAEIEQLSSKMEDARSHANKLALTLNEQKEGLNGSSDASRDLLEATETSINSYNDWVASINGTTAALDKNKEALSSPKSFAEVTAALDSMQSKWDEMGKAYTEFNENGRISARTISSLSDAFAQVGGLDVSGLLERLANTTDAQDAQAIFSQIAAEFVNASGCLDGLTDSTRQYVVEELKANGLTEIAAQLENSLAAQREYDRIVTDGLTSATLNEITALANEGGTAEVTGKQLAQYALDKIAANGISLSTVGDIENLLALARAADATAEQITKLERLKAAASGTLNTVSDADDAKQEQLAAKDWETLKTGGWDFRYTNTDYSKFSGGNAGNGSANSTGAYGNYNSGSAPSSSGSAPSSSGSAPSSSGSAPSSSGSAPSPAASSPTPQETAEDFNWIERKLETAAKLTEKLGKAFTKAFTPTSAESNYKDYLAQIESEINANNTAISVYQQHMDAIGLSYEWIERIRSGSFDITGITDEELKTQIRDYQEYYEKIESCEDAIMALEEERLQAAVDYANKVIESHEREIKSNGRLLSIRKALVALKETFGLSASKKDLQYEQDTTAKQIELYEEQNRELFELMRTTTYMDEAWQIYNDRMMENNDTIQSLTQSMAELSVEMANLPIEKYEAFLETASQKNDLYDAKLANTTNTGKQNGILGRQIGLADENNDKAQTAASETAANVTSSLGSITAALQKDTDAAVYQVDAAGPDLGAKQAKISSYYQKIEKKTNSKEEIPTSLIDQISKDGYTHLAKACMDYNAALAANDTAQATAALSSQTVETEKKNLREAQLDNTLNKNSSAAALSENRTTVTAAEKNTVLNASIREEKANRTAYEDYADSAKANRKEVGKDAIGSSKKKTGLYALTKKGVDKKYKDAANKAIKAIKAGKVIADSTLKLIAEYCEKILGDSTIYNKCEQYNAALDAQLTAEQEQILYNAESYAREFAAKREKTQNRVDQRNDRSGMYDLKAQNATTASKKNSYIDKQIEIMDKNLADYKTDLESAKTDLSSAKKTVTGTSRKGKTEKQKKIMDDINSYVKAEKTIPSSLIEDAAKVSADYQDACIKYNEALASKEEAENTYNIAKETTKQEKNAAKKAKFDNVAAEYSNKTSLISHEMQSIENELAIIEAKGQTADAQFYQNQQSVNADMLTQYRQQKAALEALLPTLEEGSDEWYDAKNQIQECSDNIADCEANTYELNNAINALNMEIFQKTADQIRRVSTEQEFLAGLMSHEAQYDENGNFTEHGLATLGTHAISYYSASENAARTKAEINELEQLLATGNLGTFNSVEQLQARLDELYTTWQTDISEISAAEQAIFDAMSAKYEAQLESLTEIVDARKEALSVEKELYDYQNQISEKTKNISTLQKQIAAYRGDTSEEGQARLQKLQVSLQEAQKDLQDTEYDKYISDQQEMLDRLVTEYQEAIQKRLENFEETVDEGLNTANQNTSLILGTLTKAAGENGYNVQYSTEGQTTLTGYVSQITAGLAEIAQKTAAPDASGSDTDANADTTSGSQSNTGTASDTQTNTGTTSGTQNAVLHENSRETQNTDVSIPEIQNTVSSQNSRDTQNTAISVPEIQNAVSSQSGRGTQNTILAKIATDFIAKNATTHKKEKIEDYSDVNQVIWKDKAKLYSGTGKVLSSANLKKLAELIGVTYNGASKKGNLYKKLAELDIKGFAEGSKNIPQDQMAWTQENGGEIIYRASDGAMLTPLKAGDKVFSSEMSNRLWELAQSINPLPNIPDATVIHAASPSLAQSTSIGDVQFNFDLSGCQNPTDIVKEIQNNYKIQQAIQSVTIDRMMGKPKLGVNHIK